MAAPAYLCRHHRASPAGWHCERCEAELCEVCVYEEPVQHTSFTGCVHCGAPVARLRIHRSATPFSKRVLGAWRYPLRWEGLAAMVAMGLIVGLMRWGFEVAWIGMKPFMFAMWSGSFWGYVMHLIRQNADGKDDLSGPDFRDFFSDIAMPAIRGTLSIAFVWAPALIYVYFFRKDGAEGAVLDPVLWVMGLLGVLYGPMAVMMAATGTSIWGMLNPVWVYANVVRIGRDYASAVAWLFACALVSVWSYLFANVALPRLFSIPLITPLIGETITSYPAFVMAYMLGTLLHVRGDAVGYGLNTDYFEIVRPDLMPKGLKPGAPAKVKAGDGAPSENPTDVAEDGMGHAFNRREAMELEPEGVEAVEQAVARNRLDDAVKHYCTLSAMQLKTVAAELHMAVGQKAASNGDFTLAVSALKAAAANVNDPSAPKACVILARVYGERLNDQASAQKLFQHVLTRYPGTSAAEFAQKALSSIPR